MNVRARVAAFEACESAYVAGMHTLEHGSRSLLPYNRSLLTLTHMTFGMQLAQTFDMQHAKTSCTRHGRGDLAGSQALPCARSLCPGSPQNAATPT